MLQVDANLFIDLITLLLHVNDEKSRNVANEIIRIYKMNNSYLQSEEKIIKFYINLTERIIDSQLIIDNKAELNTLLLKVQSDPAISDNRDIYKTLRNIFVNADKFTENNIVFVVKKLQNVIIWNKAKSGVKRMFANINRCEDTDDLLEQESYLDNINRASQDIQAVFTDANSNKCSIVEEINFTDPASIKEALTMNYEKRKKHSIKFGLQGLNRMFDDNICFGSSIVFGALQYNYKSGILMSIARWIAQYNDPPPDPEGKKALILFVSLENETHENIMWWFKNEYETRYGKESDNVSIDDMSEYVYNVFNEKGYTFVSLRHLPSEFGYSDLVATIEKYEKAGYRVLATIIDYMNKMKKESANGGNASTVGNWLLVRELYSNTCNYTKNKGILLATAHQLNRDAQKLVGTRANVVKAFNSGHMADSSDVAREVDSIVHLHIEKNQDGEKYLTMNLEKLRYGIINSKTQYCAYKFTPYGIPDDLLGEPQYLKDIYTQSSERKEKEPVVMSSLF